MSLNNGEKINKTSLNIQNIGGGENNNLQVFQWNC